MSLRPVPCHVPHQLACPGLTLDEIKPWRWLEAVREENARRARRQADEDGLPGRCPTSGLTGGDRHRRRRPPRPPGHAAHPSARADHEGARLTARLGRPACGDATSYLRIAPVGLRRITSLPIHAPASPTRSHPRPTPPRPVRPHDRRAATRTMLVPGVPRRRAASAPDRYE
ncbi:DUF6083 domain-containing protein [Streptomyces thinghirensis]|nr:DUF6083 domain-containing protein [Streptomyces thinghirensis]